MKRECWLWMLGLSGFLVGGTFSFSAPFLADEFKERGIDVEYAGVVFSMYPVGRFLASFFSVYAMNRIGKSKLVRTNYFIVAIVFLAIGMSIYLHNKAVFCVINSLLRLMTGFIFGMASISMLAFGLSCYPSETASFSMAQNLGFGVGASICPAMGALFYHFFMVGWCHNGVGIWW